MDRRAETTLDARQARRLVVLELGDVEVPPPDGIEADVHSLFVRVLGRGKTEVRVELWEHGLYHGARTVRTDGEQPELAARRIALASAALGRQLRVKRLAEARLRAQRAVEAAEQERLAALEPGPPSVRLASGLRGAVVGGDLFMAGPTLGGQLSAGRGVRLGLFMTAMQGRSPRLEPASPVEWFETGVAPGWALRLGDDVTLELGLEAALAVVRLLRVKSVDSIDAQKDTWSARAGVRTRVVLPLGKAAELGVGPDIGLMLRSIPLADERGSHARLRGAWLGLSTELMLGEMPRCPGACAERSGGRK